MLKHYLAAIAYRTQTALQDAPKDFFTFRAQPGVRTPIEIIRHMSGVFGYALSFLDDTNRKAPDSDNLEEQVLYFHELLKTMGDHLDKGTPMRNITPEQFLQGPFSDAMTHIGQLAMLRRIYGSPVPPEDFSKADITAENLGSDQAEPRAPDNE